MEIFSAVTVFYTLRDKSFIYRIRQWFSKVISGFHLIWDNKSNSLSRNFFFAAQPPLSDYENIEQRLWRYEHDIFYVLVYTVWDPYRFWIRILTVLKIRINLAKFLSDPDVVGKKRGKNHIEPEKNRHFLEWIKILCISFLCDELRAFSSISFISSKSFRSYLEFSLSAIIHGTSIRW